ncbi:ETX/MTX2 family pore-forming toxin [Bacillus sp. FDAARGOS_1420]|uniref:ETX/MTX2 family pore-forming toxin n=1 Tax=unclassified Bacillus (in: firmicutes) TaxID=185979 RepID=UPI001C5ADCA9|nr:ETX/MTX2 family pore-forming toxin [Bacillus sp. FDAARGOS_1420]MBW3496797.1 epsilon-toxin family protein [Bacillus sp. FDAARGOS_1420]
MLYTEIKKYEWGGLNVIYDLKLPSVLKGEVSSSNNQVGFDTLQNTTDTTKIIKLPIKAVRKKEFKVIPIKTLIFENGSTYSKEGITSLPSINETFNAVLKQNYKTSNVETTYNNQYYENEIPISVPPHSKTEVTCFIKEVQFDTKIHSYITLDGVIGFTYHVLDNDYEGYSSISIRELVENLNLNQFSISDENSTVVYEGVSRYQGIIGLSLNMNVKNISLNDPDIHHQYTKILSEDVEISISPVGGNIALILNQILY